MQTRTGVDNRLYGFRHLFGLTILFLTVVMAVPVAFSAENWFEQGLAAIKAGQYQTAVEKFSLSLEAVPEDFEALNNRGFARIYTGDFEGAIDDCTRSIAINPGSAKAYNNRGIARLYNNEFDAAIDDFDKALAINPRYVDAYSNRCMAWTQKNAYGKAIGDCSEALHLNPRSAKALYSRGFARDRQGDPGGAMRDYIQVLKVNRNFIEAYNSIAWIMATSPDDRLRDGRRAVAYAEKAVSTTTDINFLDTLAAAYAEAGRFDEAVALENRIISLLAATDHTEPIAEHVHRMSLYEDERPYREPISIVSVSAVTDLEGELASLDALVFTPEVTPAAYYHDDTARSGNKDGSAQNTGPSQMILAQTETSPPAVIPEAYSQSITTTPGMPVEIKLSAEPDDSQLSFEIESVPFQGALQGTLPHLMYTPRPGFEGIDKFTFRARNASGTSNLATITITVGVTPPPPTTPEPPADTTASDEAQTPVVSATPPEPTTIPAQEQSPSDAPTVEETDLEVSTASPTPEPPAAEAPVAKEAPPVMATPVTPAPPATASVIALPSDAAYTIQVRAVKSAEGAAAIVSRLQEDGHAAFSLAVEVPEKGLWYRIYINGYPSLEAAREALGKLDPERFKGAFVRRLPPGVELPATTPAAPQPEAPPVDKTDSVPAAESMPTKEMGRDDDTGRQAITVAGNFPYAYQVKSYKQKEEAFQLGVELTTQGHRAFIGRGTMGSTGVWYRVYIGCYQTPEEAEKSRSDIAREGFPEAFLTPIGFAIAVTPDDSDPLGETLENRLMASGFLPYRLPKIDSNEPVSILVGGFRHPDDAKQVLAALEQSGFRGELRPR